MKPLAVLTAASAAGLLVLASAAPASAAGNAIDPGDSLYALACDNVAPWQLYGVDAPTAGMTEIGSGTPAESEHYGCSYQAAYNPATGVSYYIQTDMGYSGLATIDVTTGVSATIAEFYFPNGEFPESPQIQAMAIGGDGSAFGLSDGRLFSIDLETAIVTYIGETIDQTYAFAWDSVTGGFYAVDDSNELYQIDVTDGSVVDLGPIVFPNEEDNNYYTYSLQFDEAGSLWLEVDFDYPDGYDSSLWSLSLSALDATVYSDLTTVAGEPVYIESLLIIPGTPVALAATGFDATPVMVGALGLLTLGGAALLLRRRNAAA
ncbi:LPXTG cell wall anchor domain-containing protein [Schumannella luteola]